MNVVAFEEDGVWFVHCPGLNVTGYGDTKDEAKASFEIVLSETINYVIAKYVQRL